ncbi:MAG: caspase family protein [Kiritimatiellae bacterium]|nr:caspase family protein [Kiritimatiellia bacterium]
MKLSAWTGMALAVAFAAAASAAHVAVCVGVNEYDTDFVPRDNWLRGCVADAGNLWTNLTERGGWTPENASLLLNGTATKAAIRAAITNAAAAAAPGDVFVYTHSSHGWSLEDENDEYTVDTGLCAYDEDYADYELAADLAKFRSGVRVVVFVDACHSGGLFKRKSAARGLAKAAAPSAIPSPAPFSLAERVGAQIDAIRAAEPVRRGSAARGISSSEIGWITAADYNQYSWDDAYGAGGEFTTAALSGWRTGACDDAPCGDEDCYADFYELWNYAKDIAVGNGEPGTEDYTEAQCANTNVLRSVRAGWVADRETLPDDPPRLRAVGDFEVDAGETVSFRVRAYAPASAPAVVSIAAGDPAATLVDGVFSFTPTAAGRHAFVLAAANANGSVTNAFTVAAYPATPENLRAGEVGTDSVEVLWDAAPGADGYWVEVDEYNAAGGWVGLVFDDDVGDVTRFVATGLKPDTKYEIIVWAYAGTDDGTLFSYDNWIAVTTAKQPSAPVWSAVSAPPAQAGRPYRLDLAPFVAGWPEPVLSLADGPGALSGTVLSFSPDAEGTNAFSVLASNDLGTATATFEVAVGALAPKKFAVCVGINEYMDISSLTGCANDAKFMSANLEERGGWEPADVTVLLDSAATKAAIRGAISNVAAQAVAGDTFVYQHSSHGGQFNATEDDEDPLTGEDGKATFLCVYDEDYYDNTTAYNDYEIAEDLAAFPSGVKVAVIVDACHSGGLFKSREAARVAVASFDLAGRVSAHMEGARARRRARGEDVARSLAASEIGWATAAEYCEYSLDGGFYHTDAWLSDPDYGDEWWVEDLWGGHYDYPESYRLGGMFLCSATWGWWSGEADADAEAGDGDGLCDVYEFWKRGYDFCSSCGTDLAGEPDYDYHPQCTNETVLRSIELGWTAPPGEPVPALPAGAAPERVAAALAGAAAPGLVEHVASAAEYDVFRAWAQSVKAAGGSAAAGADAVRASPQAWLSFALGSDTLLADALSDGDVRIASFGPMEGYDGYWSLDVEIDGVSVGSASDIPEETLGPNLAEIFRVEGAPTPDPDTFERGGFWVTGPEGGKARLVVQPPSGAAAFFMRAGIAE